MKNSLIIIFAILQILSRISPSYEIVYSCNSTINCGCSRNSVSIGRIVGGQPAAAGSWDWAVSLRIGISSLCGGTILSNQWIITAAHCVDSVSPSSITVFIGSNNQWTGSQYTVSNIYVHSEYGQNFENDIALLRLSIPINSQTTGSKPICIPTLDSNSFVDKQWPVAGSEVAAVGWGLLSESGRLPGVLHQVILKAISKTSTNCRKVLSAPKFQICAGYEEGGKDTCQGDSGGPLMMFSSSSQWVLVGITSYGDGCAKPGSPGVYTWIYPYITWIDSITSNSIIRADLSTYYDSDNLPSSGVTKRPIMKTMLIFIIISFYSPLKTKKN